MQNLLRSWIGLGRPFTVEQTAIVVKARMKRTRERRVRAWISGDMEPRASELLRFMELAGPKFSNELLETIGQTGVISIQGWMSQEDVNLAAAHYWTVQNEPGNGKERRIRRALLRLIRRARAHLSRPRMA